MKTVMANKLKDKFEKLKACIKPLLEVSGKYKGKLYYLE